MDTDEKCPFCRTPSPDSDEANERVNKRIEVGDPIAMHVLAWDYSVGENGFQQDRDKALKLWHRAAELGHTSAYNNIGNAYFNGRGAERDEKKSTHYYELGAIKGNAPSRHNLGNAEIRAGNYGRALKHFMIAVEGGSNLSLNMIQQMYMKGLATKDDYAKALRVYQAYLDEIKSDQRDKAIASSERYKYM